jgi:IS5 family transposase
MFKIQILQRYYNLSDDQMEYQILDRMSYMRFLGLKISDKVPDAKTIWHFREQLAKRDAIGGLFGQFLGSLDHRGLVLHEGSIVDASFVEVPKQRNASLENKEIKGGKTPEGWDKNKLAQKDVDARWSKKNGQNFYGYKDHVKADAGSKLITGYEVTAATVHDSQMLEPLLEMDEAGQPVYADKAYIGKEGIVKGKNAEPMINQRGHRNRPLHEAQKETNRLNSKVRSRVEHIFAFIQNSMGGSFIRSIGQMRAKAVIGLMNLTYNLFRTLQLMKIHGITASI